MAMTGEQLDQNRFLVRPMDRNSPSVQESFAVPLLQAAPPVRCCR